MSGKITVSDKTITTLAEYIVKKTDGVLALADKTGKSRRGRVYITRDRRLEMYIICRYGANTTEIYNKITSELKYILGSVGSIKAVDMRVIGVGE